MKAWDRFLLAVKRPDLLLRKLRGLDVIEVTLDEIAPFLGPCPVIVEAGALDGTDTAHMATRWPGGQVHAFEPVPGAYAQLVERVRGLSNVHTYSSALSDEVGTATINLSGAKDGGFRPDSSSLLNPKEHLTLMSEVTFGETIEVPVCTLDSWAAEVGVAGVDFLWLDLQGMELRVLQAAPGLLATVSVVCLEVSVRELYEGCALYDEVVGWMGAQGFRIAIDRTSIYFGNVLFVREVKPSDGLADLR